MSDIQKKSKTRALLVFVGCCFLQAFALGTILNSSAAFFALVPNPEIGPGLSILTFSMWITAYGPAALVGTFLGGILIPKFGPRIIVSLDIIVSAIVVFSFTFMTAESTVASMIIRGVILGVFGGQIFLYATPILMNAWFGSKRLGTFLGIANLMSGIGGAIFPTMFTAVAVSVGWKAAYYLNAIMLLVILIFSLSVFSLDPAKSGLEKYGEDAAEDPSKAAGAGVPLKNAIASAAFICLILGSLLSAFPGSYNSYIPANAVTHGIDIVVASSLMVWLQIGYILAALVGGALCDKIGPKVVTIILYAACIIGYIGFMFAGSYVVLGVVCFIFGMNNAIVTISVPMMTKEYFGDKAYEKILSYCMMAIGLCGSMGAPVLAYIYESTGSYNGSFTIGAVISVISLVFMMLGLIPAKGVRAKHWED